MNGFLSPEGVFYECQFRGHSELAFKLLSNMKKYTSAGFEEDKLQEVGFLYFGYTGNLGTNSDSYMFLDNLNAKITDEQYKWFCENLHKLQEGQKKDFEIEWWIQNGMRES